MWLIYLFINSMFIVKYSMRMNVVNPCILVVAYILLVVAAYGFAARYVTQYRRCAVALLLAATMMIGLLLWIVEPLGVNVDRWSAVTYFLDALFRGEYPYAVQTHIGNYSSPFPLWQYINIPFWLMGDVGLGLIAFLWLLAYAVQKFTHDSRTTFLYLLLLFCSPAYWWEVVVRSDGLSNGILVFSVILLMFRRNITFTTHPISTAVACALIACTRLSAALPLGILLLRSWLRCGLRSMLMSLAVIVAVAFAFFSPYIFWGGGTSMFLERNPFQTQTFQVSLPGLLFLAASVAFIAWRERSAVWMMRAIPAVMLVFILAIMLWHNMYKPGISIWEDSDFDVSYLTLSLPYALLAITHTTRKNTPEI